MARIRSVHPSQWTDEAFVSCSFGARLLAIALRNEADDHGLFAWKPLTLKMRLLPADNVDVAVLLRELEGADIIRHYEANGSEYGAIRNFCRFQKPKFPNTTHPQQPWVPSYVGLKGAEVPPPNGNGGGFNGAEFQPPSVAPPIISEALPKSDRNVSVNHDQMETESDTESERETEAPPIAAETKPAPRRGKRVPKLDELELDAELLAIAAQERRADPARELGKFRDRCRAEGRSYSDYRAAFRNWLRSDYGPREEPPRPQPARSPHADQQRRRRAEAQVEAEGLSPHTAEGRARVIAILEGGDGERSAA